MSMARDPAKSRSSLLLIISLFIFLTGVDSSEATLIQCSKLFKSISWQKQLFSPTDGITDNELNKALFAILGPYGQGKIDRAQAVYELHRLSQDSRVNKSLSIEDFENLSDRDLKSVHVFARAALNKSLQASGLNIHDRPNSFQRFIREYDPSLRLRHSTELINLIEILSKLKIESGQTTQKNDSDVGAYAYAQLQDPKVSHSDRYFGNVSFVVWMETSALDRNYWSHANPGWHYGVKSDHSFDPNYSFALFLEIAKNGARGNEVMFPNGINLHNLPFQIQAPNANDRSILIEALKNRSIPAPKGHSWEELIILPIL